MANRPIIWKSLTGLPHIKTVMGICGLHWRWAEHFLSDVVAVPETCYSAPKICLLLDSRPAGLWRGESGEMCELLHTSLLVQKMQGALSFSSNRSSFLIGELLLGKLSETVVVQGNARHDRPGFLVVHLIGNRASCLCTKAPMLRIPETNFLQGITSISGRDVQAIFSAVATSR